MRIMKWNLGYLLSRKNTSNFYKNQRHFMKCLENFEETVSILKKITENLIKNFNLWGIFKILWYLDEIMWNFNKKVRKNFIRIMQIFWKNMRFRACFAEINFNLEKIPCKRWRNFRVISEKF